MIRSDIRRKVLAVLGFVLGLAVAPQAFAKAECDMTMQTSSQWIIRHDPVGDAQTEAGFGISYVNNGGTLCIGQLEVVATGDFRHLESRTSNVRVPYALRDLSNSNNITPGTSDNLVGRTTRIPRFGTALGSVSFVVHPPADLQAGTYTRTLTLRFRMPNGEIHASTDVTLVFEVAPSIIIGLAGEFTRVNGTPTLNLGELVQDGSVPLNAKIYVRASSGYRMTVTSQNGGYLIHEQPEWTIPYSLRMGGNAINLRAPHQLNNTDLRSRTDDYPLGISVQNISGKRAGRYSDVLSFTVTAI